RLMTTVAIYDPVSGTCGGGCTLCPGISSFALAANPLLGVLNTSQQVTATVFWDNGSTTDATLQSRFSSSSPSVIAVTSTPATSGNGMASFTAVGTSTVTGTFTITGEPPGEPVPMCPSSCPRVFLTNPVSGKTQVPTYLYATGMTSTTNTC